MEIIFTNFWTFIGTVILLFFVLTIVMNFKPFHIHKYYINDKEIDKRKVENYLTDQKYKKIPTIVNKPKKEISMNDSVWNLLNEIL